MSAAHRPSSSFKIKFDICSELALYKCRYTGYTKLLCNYRYEKTEWSSNETLLGNFRLKWYAAFGIKQSSSVGKSIPKLRDFALRMSSVPGKTGKSIKGREITMQFGNYWSGPAHSLIGGGTWASKAEGGGDGRTRPPQSKNQRGTSPPEITTFQCLFFGSENVPLPWQIWKLQMLAFDAVHSYLTTLV